MGMKAIILCAGYAMRMHPITMNFPKSLLSIDDKEIVSHLVEHLESSKKVDSVHIITNSKFHKYFKLWADASNFLIPVSIIDDNTTSNAERLGAVGDLNYAIKAGAIDDDIIVLAGDNLVSFDMKEFIEFFENMKKPIIAVHDLKDKELISKKKGCVVVGDNNKVVHFEEKPAKPRSTITAPPFYIYPKLVLPLIQKYLDEGNNPDAPGHFLEWLHKVVDVHAFHIAEQYDIGTVESNNKVNSMFDISLE